MKYYSDNIIFHAIRARAGQCSSATEALSFAFF